MDFRSLTPFGHREPARTDDPFNAMRREMERMFDDMGRRFGASGGWGEAADGFGLAAPRVDLERHDGVLTLKGEKKEEKEGHYMTECSYGSFMRRIPLPCEVDEDKIEARFEKGVLTVTMPKSPTAEARSRKIAIKGG